MLIGYYGNFDNSNLTWHHHGMQNGGAKKKLLAHFQKNVGKELDKNTLSKIAGVHDWARVIRTLRQEGHQVVLLKNGCYRMNGLKKRSDGRVRGAIDSRTRYRILHRDNSTCQRCGRTPKDGISLAIDHKIPVHWGGHTVDDNLWTLCEECNLGKKHWFKEEDAESMKKLLAEPTGRRRMQMYFEMHPGELIEPSVLDQISGIRDWERTLRSIRQKTGKRIKYFKRHPKYAREGYVYG